MPLCTGRPGAWGTSQHEENDIKKTKPSGIAAALVATSIASTAWIASPTWAASASADIEATAGILPLLQVECTPLNLGVWRIPVRSGGLSTWISIPSSFGAVPQVSPNQNTVSASVRSGHTATPAQCTLSGTSAPDGTEIGLSGLTGFNLVGSGASYNDLGMPVAGLTIPGEFFPPSFVTTVGGSVVFHIGGIMEIPATVTSDAYGGYRSSSPQTLTVDDGV